LADYEGNSSEYYKDVGWQIMKVILANIIRCRFSDYEGNISEYYKDVGWQIMKVIVSNIIKM
jgi:hypothetical protein